MEIKQRVHVSNAVIGPFDLGEVKRIKSVLLDLVSDNKADLHYKDVELFTRLDDYLKSVIKERTEVRMN